MAESMDPVTYTCLKAKIQQEEYRKSKLRIKYQPNHLKLHRAVKAISLAD